LSFFIQLIEFLEKSVMNLSFFMYKYEPVHTSTSVNIKTNAMLRRKEWLINVQNSLKTRLTKGNLDFFRFLDKYEHFDY